MPMTLCRYGKLDSVVRTFNESDKSKETASGSRSGDFSRSCGKPETRIVIGANFRRSKLFVLCAESQALVNSTCALLDIVQ